MSKFDFSAKTVVELRKLAKTYGVTLGAGVSKSDIISKLVYALGEDFEEDAPDAAKVAETTAGAPVSAPAPVQTDAPVPEAPRAEERPAPASQPQYHAAWKNPSPRYNSRPAYQAPTYQQRPAWQSGSYQQRPSGDTPPRTGTVRPASFTPRFGPEAANSSNQQDDYRPAYRTEQPRQTGFGPAPRQNYGDNRGYDAPRQNSYEQPGPNYDNNGQPAYGYNQRPQQSYQPNYQQQSYGNAPAYQQPYQQQRESGYYNQELGTSNPMVSELLAAGDCKDGSGVLEMHPDGYGFLRSDSFLPSSKDIYISMAQIRRFGLRTGDRVTGKTRPQRDGDKYTAMLYITDVNGVAPDELSQRPIFDELTPVYPTRRINLESKPEAHLASMRLVDLVVPLGFGQRGLILCQPDAGKSELLRDFANTICDNHPEAEVMVLLIDENPEDVTLFRDQVKCPVLASTFDQPPENHLRLADIVLERAERLVEQQKDVILIVDSLTRLAKTYTTTAAQQGRAVPGMVNPTSLFRAKKLFGAARCMKEGGSLTVIGAMNIATGNKVDDTVVEEFKGTANMELVLDATLARAGLSPAINLQLSGTKRVENLLNETQLEGLKLVRSTLSSTHAAGALTQLLSMVEKAATNDELFVKLREWLELMKNGRNI